MIIIVDVSIVLLNKNETIKRKKKEYIIDEINSEKESIVGTVLKISLAFSPWNVSSVFEWLDEATTSLLTRVLLKYV